MKSLIYATRNIKELLRDPLNLVFTFGLPLFLLFFMTSLNKSIGVNDSFNIENFTPGTIIFSFSFLSLFSGMLIAKDRTSSFLMRMFTSPMKSADYIFGYTFPMLIIALTQSIIIFIAAIIIGLAITPNIFIAIIFLMPIALLFVGLGLLFGSIFNDKQTSGIISIIIQVVAFTSGMWFSLDLVGGSFKTIGYLLPFAHAVNLIKYILANDYSKILMPLLWTIGYVIVIYWASIIVFKKRMKK